MRKEKCVVEKKYLTCIVCPRGCELEVTLDGKEVISVIGNVCKRGKEYAMTEFTAPMRTLTTTVAVEGGGVLPCKTSKPIPKEMLFECMNEINKLRVPKGVVINQVLVSDILGTGADIVATANA